MKEIGGYFGLELKKGEKNFHDTPYHFKSGRSSLNFILQHLQPKKVYVPFYTCDALLEPLIVNDISYSFYSINESFEIAELPHLKKDELIVYVNYYDLKKSYVNYLSDLFKEKLVVDCTQSYFVKGNNVSWFFNSYRKFFGVPDGSALYIPAAEDIYEKYKELSINEDYIIDHLLLRFSGYTQKGYEVFKKNEILNNSDLRKMSKLSSYLLSNVNFDEAAEIRKMNFSYVHNSLKNSNHLDIEEHENTISNFYPYLPLQYIDKEIFWRNKIFVPVLWPDCINRHTSEDFVYEKKISKNLIPIPTDHRYDVHDMKTIITLIAKYYEGAG